MVKLCEVIGTRYFYDCNAIYRLLEQAFEKYKELDLAECKFGPAAARKLEERYATHVFRDTENPVQDFILVRNKKSLSVPVPEMEELELRFSTREAVLEYIGQLSTEKIYHVTASVVSDRSCLPFLALVTLAKPKIWVDMDSMIKPLFEYVRRNWLLCWDHHEVYNEVLGKALIERECKNGKVYIPGDGIVTEEYLVESYCVLPKEFGREKLTKNPEFDRVMDAALQEVIPKKDNVMRIRNYIRRQEVSL